MQPAPSTEQRIADRIASFAGTIGLCAKNLDTGETLEVGADSRFPAASLIKVAVMAEVYRQLAVGELSESTTATLTQADRVGHETTPLHLLQAGTILTVADLLHLMIAYSDNTATNLLVRQVRTANVNALLDSLGLPYTRLYRPTFRDGHADVLPEEEKEYGLGSTTPREAARLFELIAEGKVVSRAAGDAMIALLAEQQDRAMIPRSLPFERDPIRIAHKTGRDEEKLADDAGFRGDVRNDAAYVEAPGARWVIAVCARRIRDKGDSVDNDALRTGAELSRMVYDHFGRRR